MTLGINADTKLVRIDQNLATMNYANLLDYFAPRPIENDEQYWTIQAVIDQLLAEEQLSADGQSYLDLLAMLLESYDEAQATIPELRGVELLQTLIEESDLKQKDLLPIFKHESIISDILNGRRSLTAAHIDKLAAFFNLPHQLFFEPTALNPLLLPRKEQPKLVLAD
ncbi:MAG: hypothetical protein R3C14_47315 [Caldilineaceae bacterium]